MDDCSNIKDLSVQDDKEKDEDFVDPWTVVASSNKGVDYEKLIGKYLI